MAPRLRPDERDRHLLAHPPRPQPRRAPLPLPRSRTERNALVKQISTALLDNPVAASCFYVNLDDAPEIDRNLLVERHLISKQHATSEGARGVCVGGDETVSIMVNEEDHLRIQVLRSASARRGLGTDQRHRRPARSEAELSAFTPASDT
jgi:hypothetical protein